MIATVITAQILFNNIYRRSSNASLKIKLYYIMDIVNMYKGKLSSCPSLYGQVS